LSLALWCIYLQIHMLTVQCRLRNLVPLFRILLSTQCIRSSSWVIRESWPNHCKPLSNEVPSSKCAKSAQTQNPNGWDVSIGTYVANHELHLSQSFHSLWDP
jgi:hypothetical protein